MHDHAANPHELYSMHCQQCGGLGCYADDSSFSFASSNLVTIERNLIENYRNIAEFMNNNKLKLNGDKTYLTLLSTGPQTCSPGGGGPWPQAP